MKKFDSINVIPFIDIMLVLLAIVLTTATFVSNNQLNINIPVAKSGESAADRQQVEISVNDAGLLFINGKETAFEKAELELQLLSTDTPILLLIDEAAQFKQFVQLIDLLKRLSLNTVSILTRDSS